MKNSLLIFNTRLIDETLDTPGAVLISDGRIQKVFTQACCTKETALSLCGADTGTQLYDACGRVLMPAFIDMHVHFRYPGQTQKEDLYTGLHAAAAGGFCTVVAMPNTKPVISSIEQVLSIDREAAAYGLAKMFQTASITAGFSGSDTSHIDKFDAERVPVISEDGRDVASSAVMLDAMRKAARKGIIVSCHSEDTTLAAAAKPYREKALALMREYNIPAWGEDSGSKKVPQSTVRLIDDSLTEANRLLALAEDTATERNLAIAAAAGCKIHIAHVSTRHSMEAVIRAKQQRGDGSVSCEITPHHFALCGTTPPLLHALVNPPLRSEADRLFLIQALTNGDADVISTDHAPHTVDDKAAGSPGFTGLEVSYAVGTTVLVKENGISNQRLSVLMSAQPARLLHLNKGLIKEGFDADLVLTAPDENWTIDSSLFQSKGKATPFNGKKVSGRIHATFIGGKEVYKL